MTGKYRRFSGLRDFDRSKLPIGRLRGLQRSPRDYKSIETRVGDVYFLPSVEAAISDKFDAFELNKLALDLAQNAGHCLPILEHTNLYQHVWKSGAKNHVVNFVVGQKKRSGKKVSSIDIWVVEIHEPEVKVRQASLYSAAGRKIAELTEKGLLSVIVEAGKSLGRTLGGF